MSAHACCDVELAGDERQPVGLDVHGRRAPTGPGPPAQAVQGGDVDCGPIWIGPSF
jgi:hypothetical protein